MNELLPDEVPFKLDGPLVPYVQGSASFLAQATGRGLTSGLMSAPEQRWLVASGKQAVLLADILAGACAKAQAAGDPALATHAAYTQMQVDLARKYHRLGFRPGLCVPWGITQTVGFYTYKIHLARLRRNEAEPYRLAFDHPLCKGFIQSPADFQEGAEVTCGYCLRVKSKDPERYPLVVSVGKD